MSAVPVPEPAAARAAVSPWRRIPTLYFAQRLPNGGDDAQRRHVLKPGCRQHADHALHELALVTPFLLDPRDADGLGLRTQDVGIAYDTVGVIALTLGGLLGGWVISRGGLKRLLWSLTVCMHAPNAPFVWLAAAQPESVALVSVALAVEPPRAARCTRPRSAPSAPASWRSA